jgi:hypothetical protein
MVWKSSSEVGVRCSKSGRVTGEPSMNFEGRRARLVGGGTVGNDIFGRLGCFGQDTMCMCVRERVDV